MDTYKDPATNLEWLLSVFGPMTWDEAVQLNIEGFALPSKDQLVTLIDYALDRPVRDKSMRDKLIALTPHTYWTTTLSPRYDTDAYYVDFHLVRVDVNPKTSNYHALFVKPIILQ